jgi:hypothetical protein
LAKSGKLGERRADCPDGDRERGLMTEEHQVRMVNGQDAWPAEERGVGTVTERDLLGRRARCSHGDRAALELRRVECLAGGTAGCPDDQGARRSHLEWMLRAQCSHSLVNRRLVRSSYSTVETRVAIVAAECIDSPFDHAPSSSTC